MFCKLGTVLAYVHWLEKLNKALKGQGGAMKAKWLGGLAGFALLAGTPLVNAAVITFDDAVQGETSYAFDGDGDGVADALFSTTDPLGFNTFGPGANQQYIDEPGLEGTSELDPDLRVDFVNGATDSLSFGFALNTSTESEDQFASISVFDSAGNLLGESSTAGAFGTSDFPEGIVSVSFDGEAAYATFNFTSNGERYIIDNFEGIFGSTEVPVPEPSSLGLLLAGIAATRMLRRRNR
jgi:hypothetical protein